VNARAKQRTCRAAQTPKTVLKTYCAPGRMHARSWTPYATVFAGTDDELYSRQGVPGRIYIPTLIMQSFWHNGRHGRHIQLPTFQDVGVTAGEEVAEAAARF